MAFQWKINAKAKTDENTGFGTNSNYSGGRFFTKDGKSNVIKNGLGLLERISIYHYLLSLSRWKFLLMIFLFYVAVNLLFACIYLIIGIEHLGGMTPGTPLKNFGEAFFFSTQTFTTVGYGRISPVGFLASVVSSLEALVGLLSFALATGLLYGRFSRPQSFLRFSNKGVFAPYKEGIAFMFRMVPYKNNHLTEVEVKLTLALKITENDRIVNRFFSLDLELAKVTSLTLSWTVVHPIDDKSALFNLKLEDLQKANAEFLVFVRGFDEMFSNTVIGRTSYTTDEIMPGRKFIPMYHPNDKGEATVLEMELLNETIEDPLPPDTM
jgi:inward rectifier potassium channel